MSSCHGLVACPGWVPPPASRPRLTGGPRLHSSHPPAANHHKLTRIKTPPSKRSQTLKSAAPGGRPGKQEVRPCGAVRGRAGPCGAVRGHCAPIRE